MTTDAKTETPQLVATGDLLAVRGRFVSITGYDGFPVWVDSGRILSIKQHVDSTPEKPRCMIVFVCDRESEEWNVKTDADTLLRTLVALSANVKAQTPECLARDVRSTSRDGH